MKFGAGSLGLAIVMAGASSSAPVAGLPLPNGGTVSIMVGTADGSYDPTTQSFAEAAAAAFTAKGFTVLNDADHAALTAELSFSRREVPTALARVPRQPSVSVVGPGIAVPFSTDGSLVVDLRRTRLEMCIRRRGQTNVVWDGAAITVREADMRRGSVEAIAANLN